MEDQVNDSKFRNLRPKNKSVPEDIKQKMVVQREKTDKVI